MKPLISNTIFKEKNKIYTENPDECKNIKIYNEKLVKIKNKQYRSWNPYRSKLAAAILNGLDVDINQDFNVLYLGAATGTTVSHISDILKKGYIYAVENSAVSMKKLIKVSEKRKNIIPIYSDANHPSRYKSIVPSVDLIYQDISQRNQAEIFTNNIRFYLKENSNAIIMVKARSIDVSLKPKKAYEIISKKLKEKNFKIIEQIDLEPYEKDHQAITITI